MQEQTAAVVVSKEEFLEWKESKVTQQVLAYVRAKREEMKEYLAQGGTIAPNAQLSTEALVGHLRGLDDILNIDYIVEEPKGTYGH